MDDEVVEEDPTFKCSRCSHIFAYEGGGASEEPRIAAAEAASQAGSRVDIPPAPLEERPPTLPPPAVERRVSPSKATPPESLSFEFTRRQAGPGRAGAFATDPFEDDAGDERFAFDEDAPLDRGEPDGQQHPEPRFVRELEALTAERAAGKSPSRPYSIFLGVLIAAYGVSALSLLNHPEATQALLASVPLVGGVITEDHLLHTKIHLEDVEGTYQQIKDDRVVFIVSGRAVNTSNEPLKGVQIESALYDARGGPVDTKSIYCGNAMSLKIVKDLSSREISLLQRLEPTKRFEIRPGESAGFSVVFMSPPSGLKEFSAKVLAAQLVAS